MTGVEMMKALKAITYKPGYEFKIRLLASDIVEWKVIAELLDSDEPTKLIKTKQSFTLDGWNYQTVDQLYKHVEQLIIEFEEHEIEEWFKINGKRYREPHKNG